MRAISTDISVPRYLLSKLLARFWRGVYWSRVSPLRYAADIPEPTLPGDDWVKIRPIYGGICASDVSVVTMNNPPDSFTKAFTAGRFIMGHESLGRIIELGPAVAGFRLGDRVNVEPILSCAVRGIEPVCPACHDGVLASCHNLTAGRLPPGMSIGFNSRTSGWWSEAVVAHRSQLYKVPDALTDEQAILVDPLACALHAVMVRPPRDEETVLVFGAGILGLGVVAAVRAVGSKARLIVLARHEFQRQLCLARGADTVVLPHEFADGGLFQFLGRMFRTPVYQGAFGKPILLGGADLVIDVVGSRDTTEDSLRVVRAGGTVLMVGMNHPRWVDWDPVTHKHLTIRGAHGRAFEAGDPRQRHTYEIVHEMMLDGRLKTDGLLTHVFPLSDYQQAFRIVTGKRRSNCVKAAFRI
jgi:threonine dehydrogenase-like Zn-dependent dehydrogenase